MEGGSSGNKLRTQVKIQVGGVPQSNIDVQVREEYNIVGWLVGIVDDISYAVQFQLFIPFKFCQQHLMDEIFMRRIVFRNVASFTLVCDGLSELAA